MVKRKRIPLQLKGTDEQYFRTKEIIGKPPEDETDAPAKAETPMSPAKEDSAPVQETALKTAPAKPRQKKAAPPKPVPEVEGKGEIVSRIIHLGIPLTKRLHDTAEKFGVPIDDLLYAARKKTIAHFRAKISTSKKPVVQEFEKGGESMRVAVSLSAEEMSRLRDWYDPLDIGLATKVVSPLMTAAFRAEVKAICDAADA